MFVIDFDRSHRQAFFHGFVKGMAAPVMLYHAEQAPAVPYVTYLEAPNTSVGQTLAADWWRIGGDLQRVIDRHGKESSTTSAR